MNNTISSMSKRIEDALAAALTRATAGANAGGAPAKLAGALVHAVLPGGARIRPKLLLAVAEACGDDLPVLSDAGATAIELIHCASLVHDDLPAFDNADIRRGKPTVHRAFSEPLAVLAGDSLIILAFETLIRAASTAPDRALAMLHVLAERTGMPTGICAGQGWESEPEVHLESYHMAKTGALFVAAIQMGALAAGQDAKPWIDLGTHIGAAFQIADDLRDAMETPQSMGKPAGQDTAHARPSAVAKYGVDGAVRRLKETLEAAIASIPACQGKTRLADLIQAHAEHMVSISTMQHGA